MNKSGIYLIECAGNDKFYVGSAAHMSSRKSAHFWKLRHGKHTNPKMQNAWNKYGAAAFVFYPLEFCEVSTLRSREEYWIRALDAVKRGFNLTYDTVSPRRGARHTLATRQQMSITRKGRKPTAEARANQSAAMMGRVVSAKTRAKISAATMGRVSCWLGKRLSQKHRANLSKALTGRKFTSQHRSNIGAAFRGKTLCQEHRQKISTGLAAAYEEGRR